MIRVNRKIGLSFGMIIQYKCILLNSIELRPILKSLVFHPPSPVMIGKSVDGIKIIHVKLTDSTHCVRVRCVNALYLFRS